MEKYLNAKEIKLVHSGSNYFEVLQTIINGAKHTLYIQTYIFIADETGLEVISAIKKAVARGVNVLVMADAFGCYPSHKLLESLKEAGATCRLFAPLFSSESTYFGRRLHHKIIVADKRVALIGGINIANKYRGTNAEQPWLDYAVQINGGACEYLHLLCEKFYYKRSTRALRHWERQKYLKFEGNSLVRFRRNDWLKRNDEIHRSYVKAIVNATTSITVVASYFLPGFLFRKLLRDAARRGVKITIILAGKSDSTTLRLAETYLYDFYLKNNIKLYEWRNSVMHGKAILVDNAWLSIGSYNVNYLSRYLSIELNADIMDETLAHHFAKHLEDICQNDCNFINDLHKARKKHGAGTWRAWVAYNFHRLVQNMMMIGRKYREQLRRQ